MSLPEALQTALVDHLKLLRSDVVVHLPEGLQERDLVEAVLAASTKVSANRSYQPSPDRLESFGISQVGDSPRIIFAGPPSGHEFTSLVLALLHVSGHPPRVDVHLLKTIATIQTPLHFETFYSPTCQSCPDVVQALNIMATVNPNISHTAVNIATYATESTAREILSVPSVFVNGELLTTGRSTFVELARLILAHTNQEPDQQHPHAAAVDLDVDVAVIGGGPAGVAAAIYTARKGLSTALVAERLGGQVLDTAAIENVIGVKHTEGPTYARDLENHLRAHPVEVRAAEKVSILAPATDRNTPHVLTLDSGSKISARAVVLAPGASWRRLAVPGEDEYLRKGVTFCPHCDGPVFAGLPVAVIGGGNSGVEAALDLSNTSKEVYLLEYTSELRADAVLQEALSRRKNVKVLVNSETLEVYGDGRKVTGLRFKNIVDATERNLKVSGVFVQIGLLPATAWIPSSVQRTAAGEISVDAKGRTNVPGIFAAGDASSTPYKQIATAIASGATAAIAAFEYLATSN